MAKVKVEKKYTREFIWDRIQASDKWMVHGLLAIYNLQTPREQANAETIEDNGVGFNGVDAGFMTGMVDWWNKKQPFHTDKSKVFTDKQKAYIRKKLKKYCGQLEDLANREV